MSDVSNIPFVKSLAASDRPTREEALSSLQKYLTSGRRYTRIELLKIWKGLFFCIHHTASPLPQQRLSDSLASLLLALPIEVFIPFLSAFFETIISQWSSIPSLRLDKYLYLIRLYVASSFVYLSSQGWEQGLLDAWVGMMAGEVNGEKREGTGVMNPTDVKVGDGLRYQVLDVWVDGLVAADGWESGVDGGVMSPAQALANRGATKTLRSRAKGALDDRRLQGAFSDFDGNPNRNETGPEHDEFEGFD